MEPIFNMGLQIVRTVHVFVWFTSHQQPAHLAAATPAGQATSAAVAAAMAATAVAVAAAVALTPTDLMVCLSRYLIFFDCSFHYSLEIIFRNFNN